ncbi:MAG: S1 RNA-binding domain-containing protein [Gallicola sp.]|nr:S1 RNA-binding domain-containing protein [Gallicola sp.]
MAYAVGEILEGVVVGVTKIGAFVRLEDGTEGLVHISEISDEYVQKVEDKLSKGQGVKVKVIAINPDGKIALSIKQTLPKKKPITTAWTEEKSELEDLSFEDKLSRFMKRSNENIQQVRTRENKRGRGNRRRGANG